MKDGSFNADSGEVLSLLGPNGAGKSTTISMLSGLSAPTGGEAYFMGHSVVREPEAAKKNLGMVAKEEQQVILFSMIAIFRFWQWATLAPIGNDRRSVCFNWEGDAFCLGNEWITEYSDPLARFGIGMAAHVDLVGVCTRFLWTGSLVFQKNGGIVAFDRFIKTLWVCSGCRYQISKTDFWFSPRPY